MPDLNQKKFYNNMIDEQVDIVDEAGNVLSQTTKKEAHEKGLLHPCAVVEIKDSNGNWTLIKQAVGRQDAGQWVSPVGGHVTAAESNDQAIKREVLEEAGLKDFKYKYIGSVIFNRHVLARQENHLMHIYEVYSEQPLVLNYESVEYKKFSVTELQEAIKENPKNFGDGFHLILANLYPNVLIP